MHRFLTYSGIFLVLIILQVFLLDNLALSLYFHPLIYITFVIVLPMDMRPVWVLLLSVLMGVVMDIVSGGMGLNVMATAAVGFFRPTIIAMVCGRGGSFDDSVPALHRFTQKNLLGYVCAMVIAHSTLYFLLESLSMMHILHTILRIAISSLIAAVIVWYLVRIIVERIFKS